jgi:hypothetical protein
MTALLVDALSAIGGMTITVRHELEPAAMRLMDTLGVTVRIDPSAPRCVRAEGGWTDRDRPVCRRCAAIERRES